MKRWLLWILAGWCFVASLVILWFWFSWPSDLLPIILDVAMPPLMLTAAAGLFRLEHGRWPM